MEVNLTYLVVSEKNGKRRCPEVFGVVAEYTGKSVLPPTPSNHWQKMEFWLYNKPCTHLYQSSNRFCQEITWQRTNVSASFCINFSECKICFGRDGVNGQFIFLHFQKTLNLSSSLWRVWYMYIVFMQSLSFIQKVSFVL